jgi:hypothetical protein
MDAATRFDMLAGVFRRKRYTGCLRRIAGA